MGLSVTSHYSRAKEFARNLLTPPPAPDFRRHMPALDSVRGLAILGVLLFRFHTGPQMEFAWGERLFSLLELGGKGVDLFFVLSGFLITGILHDAKESPHYFRNFYMRRTLRIFPLYYAVLVVTLVLLPSLGVATWSLYPEAFEYQGWLWFYGANLLQAFQGRWSLGAFEHFWSLAIEEQFYLFWPLVIGCCSRLTAKRVCAAMFFSSIITRVIWVAAGGADATTETLTLFRLDELALGAWLALQVREPQGFQRMYPWAVGGAISLGLVVGPCFLLGKRFWTIPLSLLAMLFGCMLILAVAAAKESWWGKFWNSHLLQFLGKYSYGMYLFQPLLVPLVASLISAERFSQQLGSALAGRIVYLATMLTLTTLAALASWHLFEKHVLKFKRLFGG